MNDWGVCVCVCVCLRACISVLCVSVCVRDCVGKIKRDEIFKTTVSGGRGVVGGER